MNTTYVFLNIKEEDIQKYEVKALQILDSDLWKVLPIDFIDEFKNMRKDLQPSGKGSFVTGSDSICESCIGSSSDKYQCQSYLSINSSQKS